MDTRALDAVRVLKGLLALVLSCLFLFLAACGDEGNAGNGTDNGGNNTATTGKMLRMELPEGFDAEWFVNGEKACESGSPSCKVDLLQFLFGHELEETVDLDLYCDHFVYLPKAVDPGALPEMVTWDPNNGEIAPQLEGDWILEVSGDQREHLVSLKGTEALLDENGNFYLSALGLRFTSITQAQSEDGAVELIWKETHFEIFTDDVLVKTYTRKE